MTIAFSARAATTADIPCRPVTASHLHAAMDGLHIGSATFDRRLEVLFSNTAFATLLDMPDGIDLRGGSLPTWIERSISLSAPQVQRVHEACLDTVHTRRSQHLDLVLDGKQRRFLSTRIEPLRDETFLVTILDSTEQRAAEARAIAKAKLDPLTGLPNRAMFHDCVAAIFDPARHTGAGHHAVMAIDLDRFKHVNDTLGHAVGDGLLRLVAKRLRAMLRQDDVIARLGGDEFAVLVSLAPEAPDGVAVLADRIVDLLGRPYLVDGHLINIGASVGIAMAVEHGHSHEALLRSADLALYDAKARGRGLSSVFRTDMDARASARRQNEIDLRKALALREFFLHYQPQVDLEHNTIVGFEALLRWLHPDRGSIPPAEFIPLAEEIGLIVPMGEWVLTQACLEAVRWPSDVSVAVNVSPCQFEDTDRLVDAVSRALSASGLRGDRLELEITESVLLRDTAGVLTTLHRLRAMGVRIAMDDFGTGYSSLSQLHSFPFDKIKIDRSFVKDRANETGQDSIIRAIAALGASLGMATIAEGVETQGQLDRIRDGGCTSVQGYLFSRPVPVEQVGPMINRYNIAAIRAAS